MPRPGLRSEPCVAGPSIILSPPVRDDLAVSRFAALSKTVPWTAVSTLLGLMAAWEIAVRAFAVPPYLLPAPSRVATTLVIRFPLLWPDALVTFGEMIGGLAIGVLAGAGAALLMARAPILERALAPILVVTQALPVFAIAPLLVIWLGFGITSKLAMAALVIFFPVTTTFLEGLRRTDENLVDLARLHGASRRDLLFLIRVPAALPALGSGLRVAAAGAPIGAIIGEWVGSSSGLGLAMLHANARMQTDVVFAGLTILAAFSVALWGLVGLLTRRLVFWAPDTL
ncbi:ABC transporter permease [Lichenihabitans sp. Uapishka_5]|uniref:ABC transporter permease n=1 Tax=Lichenihabitans sp. Uapishka_5 TaxID=3037302 RepID=UPI0029E7EB7F|nr:ABC transporter permease [Lichenihabitans sp. Uapishka_5]MDX7950030.1 ABC transporter permease [Lichenihabitans sp. Uapishka_5]